jgi:membrane associated rhomboid family serine protease
LFPIGDENSGERLRPVVNYGLIALNLIVFLYELMLTDSDLSRFIFRWGAVPAEVSNGNRVLTIVTSQFLHGGWLHIAGNMLFLWVFGDNVEDVMGHAKYLAFYLLCGCAAALLQVVSSPHSVDPLVGASGAISGVLAAYLVLFPRGKIRTLILLGWIPLIFLFPAWVEIGYWIVLQFLSGLVTLSVTTADTNGGVAYFAHIGGFVAGLLLVLLLRDREAQERQLAARSGSRAFERVRWR